MIAAGPARVNRRAIRRPRIPAPPQGRQRLIRRPSTGIVPPDGPDRTQPCIRLRTPTRPRGRGPLPGMTQD